MTGLGGDERRIRQLLHARGVGYAPQEPPPASGWWDELYDDTHDDHHRPDAPPARAPRLGDWRKGEAADLRGPDPDRTDQADPPAKTPPAKPEPDQAEEDDAGEWADVDEPEPTAKPAPARGPRRPAARAQQAYLELPGRMRAFLYTGGAAAAGYWVGLVPLMEGWIVACGRDTGTSGALALGLGLVLAAGTLIDRRTRGWWGPLPWLCRIPLASALLALLLYAPGVSS